MALGENAVTFDQFKKDGILPPPMANTIMREAYGASVVGQLAGSIPMPITGTAMAFRTGDPVAGVVGEGELKPVIKVGVGTKTATPIKVATGASLPRAIGGNSRDPLVGWGHDRSSPRERG